MMRFSCFSHVFVGNYNILCAILTNLSLDDHYVHAHVHESQSPEWPNEKLFRANTRSSYAATGIFLGA